MVSTSSSFAKSDGRRNGFTVSPGKSELNSSMDLEPSFFVSLGETGERESTVERPRLMFFRIWDRPDSIFLDEQTAAASFCEFTRLS